MQATGIEGTGRARPPGCTWSSVSPTAAARAASRAACTTSTWSRTTSPTCTTQQHDQHHEGEDQGELDGGLAAVGPGPPASSAHFTEPMTCARTKSKSLPIASVFDAQVMTSEAMAAAPSSTSAYSAVV